VKSNHEGVATKNSRLQKPPTMAWPRLVLSVTLAERRLLCDLAARYMSRPSSYSKQLCQLCAQSCDACAAECERFPDDHCTECAAKCRTCAAECRSMPFWLSVGAPMAASVILARHDDATVEQH
jgi:hypothetical protein